MDRTFASPQFPPYNTTSQANHQTKRADMKLSEYFEQAKGVGVLATTDLAGR